MRVASLILALCAQTILVTAAPDMASAKIYIEPVNSGVPDILAEVLYNSTTLSARIASFQEPEVPEKPELVRIGIYDVASSSWKTSTSVISSENFAKGYVSTFVLALDAQGEVISVSCRGAKIDAGATRDFRPQAVVQKMGKGKVPGLNRPVVLSPDGKLEEPVPEKTMLQKYWWVLLAGVMLLITSGGSE